VLLHIDGILCCDFIDGELRHRFDIGIHLRIKRMINVTADRLAGVSRKRVQFLVVMAESVERSK
ncbi:MAG: hypothetical protein K0R31_1560, partial [Clostridiales bacterium]|nr:hypothetical protein [Clostridiales bacterium]